MWMRGTLDWTETGWMPEHGALVRCLFIRYLVFKAPIPLRQWHHGAHGVQCDCAALKPHKLYYNINADGSIIISSSLLLFYL